MDKPLRILIVLNLPWDRRLGASRIYIELAEHWKAAGHQVEKFCLTDAFPEPTDSPPLSMLRQVWFAYRAASYLRRNAARFDVIDALIGTLPFSKKNLRFRGLLAARSVGLHRVYEQFIRFSRTRWPDQPRGKFLGRLFYPLASRWQRRNSELSIRNCDLINLPNEDESKFLQEQEPAIVHAYGLSEEDRAAFAHAMQPPETRLHKKEISFVGMWGLRKGGRDWPEIIRRIREVVPDSQFKFLGTVTPEQTVLRDLRLSRADGISCVPSFDPDELPVYLAGCAVGIFPSYIEGFGLAVLEQLACGIPTIAYDVAGPRQILDSLRARLLVPRGDALAMAARAIEILYMNASDYAALSERCRSIADQFRWEDIARDTAQSYRDALRKLPDRA